MGHDWFEYGREGDDDAFHRMIYPSKRYLLEALEAIGKQPSIERLEEELSKIDLAKLPDFRGGPYLLGESVAINAGWIHARCYLGYIKQ